MSPLEKKRMDELVNRVQVYVSNLSVFVQSGDFVVAQTAARAAIENLQEIVVRLVNEENKK